MARPIELCRDLTIELGGRRLLAGGTLEAQPGEVTVLMGPSGVGKSILADVIFGIEDGRAGGGLEVTNGARGEAPDRGALVFQHGGGLPHLTVGQNVTLAGTDREHTRRTLEALPLRDDQQTASLSGGQHRRLATARALVARRNLLWLDEPAAGLDVTGVDDLVEQLEVTAREDGVAIVVTTHRAELAVAVADRLVFLGYDGHLQSIEPVPESAVALESTLRDRIRALGRPAIEGAPIRQRPLGLGPWLDLGVAGIGSVPRLLFGEASEDRITFRRAFRLAGIEGRSFYPFVGLIFGFIFVLIFKMALTFVSTGRVLVEFGPTVVLRLSPALSAILIAARAGSAISAWVGQMTQSRQLDAVKVLGVSVERRIAAPIWAGLTLAGALGTLSFALALVVVFAGYLLASGEGHPLALLMAFEPSAIAVTSLKAIGFSALVASVTVACALEPKHEPAEVASGITRGIVLSAVTVMLLELAILAVQFWVG